MELFKRLSVRTVTEGFGKTIRRFPLPVIFSILTCILLITLIEYEDQIPSPLITKSIFVSILGFFFTLISSLYIENSSKAGKIKYILQLIVITLLAYLFITMPSKFMEREFVIFSVFLSASFFALMFVYTKKEDDESYFGIYNISLFMRGFISFVFAAVLFLGTASALLAIHELFLKGNFHEKLYAEAWFVSIAFFAPVYFLSGLPDNNSPDTGIFSYPKPLKILLQFIIVPLVTLYLIILYSYTIKIILTQKWPEGIVSYMIITYSLVGIVAVILLSPLKGSDQYKWIHSFSKYFFRALIPMIVVLFMAIMERVSQYGITEKRYFIFVLSFWLAGITLYMVFSRRKNLVLMPVTLSIISVLSLYGPWSCFSISKHSQLSILEDLLAENGILVNGEVIKSAKSISFKERKSISSIISYFYDNHGINSIPYMKATYQKLAAENKDYPEKKPEYSYFSDDEKAVPRRVLVKEGLGFDFIENWNNENSSNNLNIAVKYFHDPVIEDISDYDSYIDCRDNLIKARVLDSINNVYVKYDAKNFLVSFEKENNEEISAIDLKIFTQKIIDNNTALSSGDQVEPAEMKHEAETEKIKYMVLIRNFGAKRDTEKDPYKLENVYFSLYYKLKPSE